MPQELVEIIPSFATAVSRIVEHMDQTFRSCKCVPARPVPGVVLDAVIIGNVVERLAIELRQQSLRQAHSAEPLT